MIFLDRDWRPRRSVLFLPASNPRAIAKAATLPCDCVIFDLEDSVAPEMADAARRNVRSIDPADFGGRERIVRVSAFGSRSFEADFEAALSSRTDAILLPKVEAAGAIVSTSAMLDGSGSPARLWAMVETPQAILEIAAIARADARLQALVMGPNDLSKATGVPMLRGRAAFVPWFMSVIAAGRANRLCILDGVYNDFRNAEGLAEECRGGALLGFDGKTLIHPSQVDAANAAFSPSAEEFAAARRVVEAFALPENRLLGAIALDGVMVERLHLENAGRLLQWEHRFKS
jgi:citrate lyase subunit beta/citryl-CoA lyase